MLSLHGRNCRLVQRLVIFLVIHIVLLLLLYNLILLELIDYLLQAARQIAQVMLLLVIVQLINLGNPIDLKLELGEIGIFLHERESLAQSTVEFDQADSVPILYRFLILLLHDR